MAVITTHKGHPYYKWREEAMGSPPPHTFDESASAEGTLYHDWQHGVSKRQAKQDYEAVRQSGIGPPPAPTLPPAAPPSVTVTHNGGTAIVPVATVASAPPISHSQQLVADILLGVGVAHKAPRVALDAIIYAALGETSLGENSNTYGYNGVCCWGVLQGGRDEWPDPHDTAGMAQAFFTGKGPQGQTDFHHGAINLAKEGVTSPAEIAVRVEVPSIWPADAYVNNGTFPSESAGNALAHDIVQYVMPGLPTSPAWAQPPAGYHPIGAGDLAYLIPQLNWAGDLDAIGQAVYDRGDGARKLSRATRRHVTHVALIPPA